MKIGFIGCGKMAQAMIGGMIKDHMVTPEQILVSAKTEPTLNKVKAQFNIQTTLDNRVVASNSNLLFLAVAPSAHRQIIEDIRDVIQASTIIITIAAGISTEDIQKSFQKNVKVVRSMPNTPSLVGEGMTALCANLHVTDEELNDVVGLFQSFSRVEVITEGQMDAIPGISGASPAYVYMFIEALADGGVRQGLPREQANRLASQAVLGAAKMVLETGKHPGELKDQVCSPGGATIEAVAKLEEKGLRGIILSAIEACTNKVVTLGK